MGARKAAALAAALLVSAPAGAQEIQDSVPMTMFYVSIPLGGATVRERMPSYGLAWKGRKQYETVYLDSRTMNQYAGVLAGLEAKWLIAGGLVAAAGIYAMSSGGGGGGDGNSGSGGSSGASGQSSNPPAPTPCQQTDPCKK